MQPPNWVRVTPCRAPALALSEGFRLAVLSQVPGARCPLGEARVSVFPITGGVTGAGPATSVLSVLGGPEPCPACPGHAHGEVSSSPLEAIYFCPANTSPAWEALPGAADSRLPFCPWLSAPCGVALPIPSHPVLCPQN